MHVYAVANQKGGVGKTTTALALAALMKRDGKRVLLIDADPQGNSTDVYGALVEGETTLYDVILDDERCDIKDAIQHLEVGDIVAADPLLRKADECLTSDVEGLYRLSDAVASLDGAYDYVIIDTAPVLNLLLYNALVAADEVIVPVLADRFSIVGLSQLYDTVKAVKRRQNPKLKIAGLLLVKYGGRTNLSRNAREVMDRDAQELDTVLFGTAIRECVKCQEAQAAKTDLFAYAPACTTAQDYEEFYRELVNME